MTKENSDELRFENHEEKLKYKSDAAGLRRIRETSHISKEEKAYQKDISYDDIIENDSDPVMADIRKYAVNEDIYINGSDDISDINKDSDRRSAKKQKKNKWWTWFVAVLLFVVLAYPVYGMFIADGLSGMYTIAVFGLDSRDGNTGKGALSDVNMLVQINRDTAEIRLVSIYRDTYVQIREDDYYHKFNQAYHQGGHEQALWTLEHNTEIKPDDYAAFSWKAVAEGINLLGGIDLEITDKEFAYINGFITETVNSTGIGSTQLKGPGMQHLDGVQAVAYARLRLMDNDFKRTERQRKVISLCLEKAKQADVETLMTIAQTVLPQIETSMDMTDLLPLLKNMSEYRIIASKGWPFENVPMKVTKRGSCVVPATLESNVAELHQFLYPQPDLYKPGEGVVKSSRHIEQLTGVHQIAPKETETTADTEYEAGTAEAQ